MCHRECTRDPRRNIGLMQKELTGKPTRESHAVMQIKTEESVEAHGQFLPCWKVNQNFPGEGNIELSLKDKSKLAKKGGTFSRKIEPG